MLYNFNVVSSINSTETLGEYFKSLATAIERHVSSAQITPEVVGQICEYLDIVDSGDLAMKRSLYRQCVGALWEYLANCPRAEAHLLAQRSWAAKTLHEMQLGETTEAPLLLVA